MGPCTTYGWLLHNCAAVVKRLGRSSNALDILSKENGAIPTVAFARLTKRSTHLRSTRLPMRGHHPLRSSISAHEKNLAAGSKCILRHTKRRDMKQGKGIRVTQLYTVCFARLGRILAMRNEPLETLEGAEPRMRQRKTKTKPFSLLSGVLHHRWRYILTHSGRTCRYQDGSRGCLDMCSQQHTIHLPLQWVVLIFLRWVRKCLVVPLVWSRGKLCGQW